jgi:hypothetical protein
MIFRRLPEVTSIKMARRAINRAPYQAHNVMQDFAGAIDLKLPIKILEGD